MVVKGGCRSGREAKESEENEKSNRPEIQRLRFRFREGLWLDVNEGLCFR
jgi:hypothetical protein